MQRQESPRVLAIPDLRPRHESHEFPRSEDGLCELAEFVSRLMLQGFDRLTAPLEIQGRWAFRGSISAIRGRFEFLGGLPVHGNNSPKRDSAASP